MGNRPSAKILYGFMVDEDHADYALLASNDDDAAEAWEAKEVPATEATGVEVHYVGSWESYTRAVGFTIARSPDWFAVQIDPPVVPPDADERIRRFCEMTGISYQAPAMWLSPFYG